MNGVLIVARMEFDDLPIRLFSNRVSMSHWLQFSKGTFDETIDAIVAKHKLPRSQLLGIESWEYINGELFRVEHIMGSFQKVEDLNKP